MKQGETVTVNGREYRLIRRGVMRGCPAGLAERITRMTCPPPESARSRTSFKTRRPGLFVHMSRGFLPGLFLK